MGLERAGRQGKETDKICNVPYFHKILVTCRSFVKTFKTESLISVIKKKRMKQYINSNRSKVYFSCWSRKGFAVFAALGKNICISVLALHMYGSVLLKAARRGIMVNRDTCAEAEENCPVWKEIRERCNLAFAGEVCPDENKNDREKKYKLVDMTVKHCISLF